MADHGFTATFATARTAAMAAALATALAATLGLAAAVDVPLALATAGLGTWIIIAPWSVPGLTPPMM